MKLPAFSDNNKKKDKPDKKPRIPKTEYDSEGNPVLSIPDLNDVNLNDEIDKYFGRGSD